MLIFLQEIVMLLFLWFLRLIDGIMEIFSSIAGVTDVTVQGERVNIIEYLVGDSTVGTIFWCVFILAVGLTCIFGIVALVKNMIANNRNISSIIGKIGLYAFHHIHTQYRLRNNLSRNSRCHDVASCRWLSSYELFLQQQLYPSQHKPLLSGPRLH